MKTLGQRIAVVGTSGSGKTHVARALADRLGIPFICNDSIIWAANWQNVERAERCRRFDLATNLPAWTLDGNFGSMADAEDHLILSRADTLVWLDLPRREVFAQVIARTIRRAATREVLWHGNRESWRQSFASRDSIILWSIRTYDRRRRQYGRLFQSPDAAHCLRIRLGSRRAVNRWLADLGCPTC